MMNRKDEWKLELLDGIDEALLERSARKRYALMQKNRMKRSSFWAVCGGAACFAAACVLFFVLVLPILTKVPVYEGMTVSGEVPFAALQADSVATLRLLGASDEANTAPVNPIPSAEKDLLKAPAPESGYRASYYTDPNSDVYVTVHLDNPKQYEILSFTLNGVKYQSYMFEEGSDSENLILKVNVGDVKGVVEYRIDAIKYVDGERIKNVIMRGDRTVKIGVYTDDQPIAAPENVTVARDRIAFDVRVQDELSLIADSEGEVYVSLTGTDGKTFSQGPVSLKETNRLLFEGLKEGEIYQCRISARYDALDGNGSVLHPLYEGCFATAGAFEVLPAQAVTSEEIRFDLQMREGEAVTLLRVEIIRENGKIVREQAGDVRAFGNLAPGRYWIRAVYAYGDGRLGAAVCETPVKVNSALRSEHLVEQGRSTKPFSGDLQVWNPSTADYRSHLGVDITSSISNAAVYSAYDGTVQAVYFDKSYGNTVVISVDEGDLLFYYQSLGSTLVKEGDRVSGGQRIGTIGESAMLEVADENPIHLHFAVKKGEDWMDPFSNTLFS